VTSFGSFAVAVIPFTGGNYHIALGIAAGGLSFFSGVLLRSFLLLIMILLLIL
jgi:hypothetical protein